MFEVQKEKAMSRRSKRGLFLSGNFSFETATYLGQSDWRESALTNHKTQLDHISPEIIFDVSPSHFQMCFNVSRHKLQACSNRRS